MHYVTEIHQYHSCYIGARPVAHPDGKRHQAQCPVDWAWGTRAYERSPPVQRQTGFPRQSKHANQGGGVVREPTLDIAVDNEADVEQAIKERRGRAGGHDGGGGNWGKARGEQTLESLMVRSVRPF